MSDAFDALKERTQASVMNTYGRYPLALAKGSGCTLHDLDGREYLDLLAGIAVANLGHSHPEIADALARQARELVHVSNLFFQTPQVELAEALLGTWGPGRVFFCNSGAEANEGAIKLARRYQRTVRGQDRFEVITLTSSFHGRTLATLTATGQDKVKEHFQPLPEGFVTVPAGDLEALRAAFTPRTAAVLLEVVQGEGGVKLFPEAYLRGVQALCREQGALFMVDEIQTGMCRTGRWWAHQHHGLEPDVFTAAKALANGLPMGAVLATEEVARGFEPGSHATTFGGTPLVCAAALKTVEIMHRERIAERAARMGDFALALFADVAAQNPGKVKEVRGLGLMIGIDLAFDGQKVWEELMKRGFILNLTQGTVLRLLPPLVIEQEELRRFAQALSDVLAGQ
ncbi:Acetylornithine aminotransferase [Fundidesulfovibrio magnetotacticus]|uniref:Acetylornithine aminotransferase n=1 Tax=Fundidesulfovibrio magnetotacticus TaxID=2730080 RepID=A0A6V8M1X1_9BACT|nr:aspartate aminotransferase family protein [Fundidesulfovibrio magnetotacticus]GFK95936.1 Acetylornithine aminotransferase [Fundidesulfovibrio magnetotacticus]